MNHYNPPMLLPDSPNSDVSLDFDFLFPPNYSPSHYPEVSAMPDYTFANSNPLQLQMPSAFPASTVHVTQNIPLVQPAPHSPTSAVFTQCDWLGVPPRDGLGPSNDVGPQRTSRQVKIPPEKGRKTYGCTWCSHVALKKNAFEKHLRTHTGERPFVCEDCKKAFTVKCNLSRHQRTCKARLSLCGGSSSSSKLNHRKPSPAAASHPRSLYNAPAQHWDTSPATLFSSLALESTPLTYRHH